MGYSTVSLFFCIITSIAAVTYVYFKWSFQYWMRKNMPYIQPTIPFGNSENPLSTRQILFETIFKLYKQARAKGWRHCGIYVFTSPVYLILDVELVKQVLTKDFIYFTDRGVYTNEKYDPIGCHLFAVDGSRWKNLRAKLTPTFTSGKLKAMFQNVVDCGVALEIYLEQHVSNNEPVDIKQTSKYFTSNVIGSCAFGIECNSFKHPNSSFIKYGNKFFTEPAIRSLTRLFVIHYPNLARWLGIRQVSKDISDFYTKIVEDVVAYREKNNIIRNDFMQLLINAKNDKNEHNGDGKSLTMDEIIAQSFVFFLAGYDTSANTMSFVLFELATRPEIQLKVKEEINTVLRRHDNQITYDSLSELTYLNQVIEETLRVYSPARVLTRRCVRDYKVSGEDVVIEKGTFIFISVKGIHMDDVYHKNPNVFNPDRFNEENKKKMNPYTFLPFGHGPRSCIGERFGIIQVKVGVTAILRKFKISLNEKTKIPLTISPVGLVTTAEEGIWLNLKKN